MVGEQEQCCWSRRYPIPSLLQSEASTTFGVESSHPFTYAFNEVFLGLLKESFELVIPDEFVIRLYQVSEWLHYRANGICPGDLIDQTEPGASVGDVLWRWEVSFLCGKVGISGRGLDWCVDQGFYEVSKELDRDRTPCPCNFSG